MKPRDSIPAEVEHADVPSLNDSLLEYERWLLGEASRASSDGCGMAFVGSRLCMVMEEQERRRRGYRAPLEVPVLDDDSGRAW